MKSSILFGAAAGLLLLTLSTAHAADMRYAPWQGQVRTGDMPELLRNLSAITDQAEQDKAANPAFLADLRRLVDAYDSRYRWPVMLLFDDFRDGESANNPAWTAVSGSWRVTNRAGSNALTSSVRRDHGNNAQSNSGNTANALANMLGSLLNQQAGQGQNQTDQGQSDQYQSNQYQANQYQANQYQSGQNQQGRDVPASIMVPVAIADQFYIRLALVSRHGSQFNFGPYAGRHAQDSYQVTYVAGAANGLVLSRTSNQGGQLLGQSRGPVNLEDNQSHVIEWKRGPAGKMVVILDGVPVIEASDAENHRPFSGFLMANGGGTFEVQSVAINGTNQ